MNNVLLINLKRYGDIFCMGHQVNDISRTKKVSLLVYKEFESAAKCLNNVTNIYTIDRKRLILLNKNPLFSKASALNLFHKEVEVLLGTQWDQVINYSNEIAASYITSMLKCPNYKGVRISKHGTIEYSNKWSLYLNEVMTQTDFYPYHILEITKNMIDTKSNPIVDKNKIIEHIENKAITRKNFSSIRDKYHNPNGPIRLIGIQLKTSKESKDIPYSILLDLIKTLLNSAQYFPLLLIAPDEQERMMVEKLNQAVGEDLISIESDFSASCSIIKELDGLITPDTSIKHIADLVDTPTLEVSLGESPFHLQGSIRDNNLILSPVISKKKNRDYSLDSHDIYQSLDLLFGDISSVNDLSRNLTLYRVVNTDNNPIYIPIAGTINSFFEINYLIGRHYSSILVTGDKNKIPFESIGPQFSSVELSHWVGVQKENITHIVKDLLTGLRSLKLAKEDPKNGDQFLEKLNIILDYCDRTEISSIPIRMFRGKIEAIQSETVKENVKEMEELLFSLKNQIQILSSIIGELESYIDKRITKERHDSISHLRV